MMRENEHPVPDLALALGTLMLLAIGLVLIYSSSAILAMGRSGDSFYYIKRQLVFAAAGVFALVAIMKVSRDDLRDWSGLMMIAVIGMLALTLVPGIGKVAGGARRWLGAGPLRFQPSELAKIALVIFAADRLSKPAPKGFSWKAGVPAVIAATGVTALLTLLEPDFGSSVMIVLIAASMLFCAGLSPKLFIWPALGGVPLAAFIVLHSAYRLRRVQVFLDPWKDPNGAGFQIVHSLMAFGTGGLLGQGLGQGKQKLYYLPEPHTDFIFSTAGEEFGFLGCLTLVALFMLLLWRGFMIALRSKDNFLKLASLGITVMLGLQVVVNLFVVLGLAPTKGTTLPFLSCGGSALVVDLAAVGLLLNFSKEKS
jgi:cell division protein FtsW